MNCTDVVKLSFLCISFQLYANDNGIDEDNDQHEPVEKLRMRQFHDKGMKIFVLFGYELRS